MQSRQTKQPTNVPQQQAMFQEQSFGVPVQKVQKSPQANLSKSLMRAEQYGHNFSHIHPTSVSEQPLQMQSLTMGNLPISKPLVQPKLTIGQPGDKYEQEANKLASQVANQINAPTPQSDQSQPVQRETIPEEEDELMMKPQISHIQREPIPEEEKQLQMKPMLQLQAGDGDTAATSDLEASINQARGSGQPLAENIRQPMEQAFGADFSGVKVHTDARSDQLNRSIQAKAFTTGQDVFFRQGEYNPGSRDGQELLAHELTHVVQQKGNRLQRMQNESRDQTTETKIEIVREMLRGLNFNYDNGSDCRYLATKAVEFAKSQQVGASSATVLSHHGAMLVPPDPIKGDTRTSNTEGIRMWSFQEHFWCEIEGIEYDPLYDKVGTPEMDTETNSLRYREVLIYQFNSGKAMVDGRTDGLNSDIVFNNLEEAKEYIDINQLGFDSEED